MKNKIITGLVLIVCLLGLATKAQAFCLVSSESGNVSNHYGLPYHLSLYSGKGTEALCGSLNGDPLDVSLGFTQAILFTRYIESNEEWQLSPDVKKVILSGPLSFNNTAVNIVIGNWPMVKPESSAYAYSYKADYVPVTADYGMVTIDGRTSFQDKVSPFECKADTKEVVLRNLIIQTKGLSRAALFDMNKCLRDGGAVHVCDGDVVADIPVGQSGWCKAPAPAGGSTGGTTGTAKPTTVPPTCKLEVTPTPVTVKQGGALSYSVKVMKQNSTNVDITDFSELIVVKDEKGRILVNDSTVAGNGAVNKDGSIDTNSDLKLAKDIVESVAIADGKGISKVQIDLTVSKSAKTETKNITVQALGGYYAENYQGTGKGSWDFYNCSQSTTLTVAKLEGETLCGDKIDNDGDAKSDCDDTDCTNADVCKSVPKSETSCSDNLDDDKDQKIDCEDADCAGKTSTGKGNISGVCPTSKETSCADKKDEDNDGKTDCDDTDCAADAACKKDSKETICNDKIDEDKDGKIDCDDDECKSAAACSPDNLDTDKDGVAKNAGDCDDNNPLVSPKVKEICGNGIDDDCNGLPDTACNGNSKVDDDGDGYCEDLDDCDDSASPGDCDDNIKEIHPVLPAEKASTEICNDDIDNNCDGIYGVKEEAPATPATPGTTGTGGTPAPASTAAFKAALVGQDAECIDAIKTELPATGGGCGCDLTAHRSSPVDSLPLMLLVILPLALVQVVRYKAMQKVY